jgi:hypothetical protein
MAGALQPPAARAGVTFNLDGLEVERGRLVVTGRWFGVRGMRFVRPTLVVGDRAVLATLEHKPWAPDGVPWTAAFPWEEGAEVDLDGAAIAVAPSVTVPLGGSDTPAPPRPPAPDASPGRARPPLRRPQRDVVPDGHDELRALRDERDALRRRLDDAQAAADQQRRTARDAARMREDVDHARAAAERDRDRLVAQLEEAVGDREAAVRTRERMEVQYEDALRERGAAEDDRDRAVAQLQEARAQRDEILVAHRALQRHVDGARAAQAAASPGSPTPPADTDAPIGVRAIPAARTVAAELERSPLRGRRDLAAYDLWAIRVLGTIAAVCFVLLLAMLLRVFL